MKVRGETEAERGSGDGVYVLFLYEEVVRSSKLL